ncbi:hypothetical protein GLOTRDRAFT_131924 [Gloeophyllum trabeum ATCC 11539]|uniref:Uncharacterized protein n=1 Tax=Gloeophyllum trabeum (strain ATCC 11539 / FP-39264 / Madison 617) TaxID=670483 RepID=S7PYZ0_GLOTA|nr:uncharacterized protein GLOTRDRAFT_131924 [Gloeophyllum trabeum ATCC 11539]EPQ52688.1 hypothetical protein GLOTRDRAFT_131924 [Gloeophyllum trabeum ATCC 11539]
MSEQLARSQSFPTFPTFMSSNSVPPFSFDPSAPTFSASPPPLSIAQRAVLKRALVCAHNLATCDFSEVVPTIKTYPYPLDSEGCAVVPSALGNHMGRYDCPWPVCMCNERCRFIEVKTGPYHWVALVLAYGFLVVVEDVLSDISGAINYKQYAPRSKGKADGKSSAVPRRAIRPPPKGQLKAEESHDVFGPVRQAEPQLPFSQGTESTLSSPEGPKSFSWSTSSDYISGPPKKKIKIKKPLYPTGAALMALFEDDTLSSSHASTTTNSSDGTFSTPSSTGSTSTASSAGIGPIYGARYLESGYMLQFPATPTSNSRAFDLWSPPPFSARREAVPAPAASSRRELCSIHGVPVDKFWNSWCKCQLCGRVVHADLLIEDGDGQKSAGNLHMCFIDLTSDNE